MMNLARRMAYLDQLIAIISVKLKSLKALHKFHYGHFNRRVSPRNRLRERDGAEGLTNSTSGAF
jgi:hypothetical protein